MNISCIFLLSVVCCCTKPWTLWFIKMWYQHTKNNLTEWSMARMYKIPSTYHSGMKAIIIHTILHTLYFYRRFLYQDYIMSDDRLIEEWWTAKDLEGSSQGLNELLPIHFPGGTVESHAKAQSGKLVFQPRFVPSTSWMQVYSFSYRLACLV